MIAALRLRAKGRVQRVGFRRYAQEVARELGLVGWVKNLPDGDVELRVQGPRERLEAFVERLKAAPPPICLKELQVEEVEPENHEEDEEILCQDLSIEVDENGIGCTDQACYEASKPPRQPGREHEDQCAGQSTHKKLDYPWHKVGTTREFVDECERVGIERSPEERFIAHEVATGNPSSPRVMIGSIHDGMVEEWEVPEVSKIAKAKAQGNDED